MNAIDFGRIETDEDEGGDEDLCSLSKMLLRRAWLVEMAIVRV